MHLCGSQTLARLHVDDDDNDNNNVNGDVDGDAAFIGIPQLVHGRHCHLYQSALHLCSAVSKALQSSCPPSEQRPALEGDIFMDMTAAE